jgi:hypothetical protein
MDLIRIVAICPHLLADEARLPLQKPAPRTFLDVHPRGLVLRPDPEREHLDDHVTTLATAASWSPVELSPTAEPPV